MGATAKLKKISEELKQTYIERDEVIDGMIYGLLARQHVFLVGPPGTAKSMMASDIADRVGGSYFYTLVTSFSTPEAILGPISVTGLREDNYRRITENYMPTCHIACIDEIFKGTSALLNSLNSILCERKLANGNQVQSCPIISAFCSSNEIPLNQEDMLALYDRFLLRFKIDYLEEGGNFRKLLLMGDPEDKGKTRISLDELYGLQSDVEKVVFGGSAIEKMLQIRNALRDEGVKPSDRRWKDSMNLIRAHALVEGRKETEDEDLEVLTNVLWSDPDAEIPTVNKVVLKYANPELEAVMDLLSHAQEIADNARSIKKEADKYPAGDESQEAVEAGHRVFKAGIDASAKLNRGILKEISSVIEDAKAKGKNTERLEKRRDEVAQMLAEIKKEFLGEIDG